MWPQLLSATKGNVTDFFFFFFNPAASHLRRTLPRIPQKGQQTLWHAVSGLVGHDFIIIRTVLVQWRKFFTPWHTEPRLPKNPPDLLNISVGGGWNLLIGKKNCPQTAMRQMWYLCEPMRCRLSLPYRWDLMRAKQSGRGAEELITKSLSHMLAFHHHR